MNRRKFIKKGLQVSGAGLLASIPGCQGSWFEPFAGTAQEAIIAENAGSRIFNVNLGTGAVSTILTMPANIWNIALLNESTVLAVSNSDVYTIDLNNNTYQTLLSGFTSLRGLAVENRNSILLSGSGSYFARMNISTLAVSVFPVLGTFPTGIAIENSSSALVLDFALGDLYRVNLSTGVASNIYTSGAANTFPYVAFVPDRNLALFSIDPLFALQVRLFDLSTNTPLSFLGALPNGAGQGIALENSSSVLVGNNAIGVGGLYRVNLDTGVTSRVDDGTFTGIIVRAIAVRFQ